MNLEIMTDFRRIWNMLLAFTLAYSCAFNVKIQCELFVFNTF